MRARPKGGGGSSSPKAKLRGAKAPHEVMRARPKGGGGSSSPKAKLRGAKAPLLSERRLQTLLGRPAIRKLRCLVVAGPDLLQNAALDHAADAEHLGGE